MKTKSITSTILIILSIIVISCNDNNDTKFDKKENAEKIKHTLEKVLLSIENKDITSLQSTMSPSGKMELILPNTKISYTTKEFIDLHKEWFKDTTWTMETNILNIESGKYIGTATTEAIYRESNRNGKPYLNHMIVTYVLEKDNDKWYVIKDHASSLKKTTN